MVIQDSVHLDNTVSRVINSWPLHNVDLDRSTFLQTALCMSICHALRIRSTPLLRKMHVAFAYNHGASDASGTPDNFGKRLRRNEFSKLIEALRAQRSRERSGLDETTDAVNQRRSVSEVMDSGFLTAQDWRERGDTAYEYRMNFLNSHEGRDWFSEKQAESKAFVEFLKDRWGLQNLQSGTGVIDVGGDPGILAAEFLRNQIPVTVIDPAWGMSGKRHEATESYLSSRRIDLRARHGLRIRTKITPFKVIQKPFDRFFVDDPKNADLLLNASAIVGVHPDEVTGFLLRYSASRDIRTAVIPCDACEEFFPKNNATYEGFVHQLLQQDRLNAYSFETSAPLQRTVLETMTFNNRGLEESPRRSVVLLRSPRPQTRKQETLRMAIKGMIRQKQAVRLSLPLRTSTARRNQSSSMVANNDGARNMQRVDRVLRLKTGNNLVKTIRSRPG
eukprot:gnl/MRDRNA2_/MRDRNA2_146046_c0_seq1.p1 gnl/MRDRNA2_/MRDRNA2_146046_c0~~gnl/MRDRNA2_/MRDRNA2_146046_c0_seq1.p1  ORF type:complete len:447 (+),score=48.94 gnl/MRDRNA2_/MRDRNA2_146046_c0_seq1:69-1409(+)